MSHKIQTRDVASSLIATLPNFECAAGGWLFSRLLGRIGFVPRAADPTRMDSSSDERLAPDPAFVEIVKLPEGV